MYSKLYTLYNLLQEKSERKKECKIRTTFRRYICSLIYHYMNTVHLLWMKLVDNRDEVNRTPRKEPIIVSLTSFPGRIDTVWITIESLLSQDVKPDKIILWLAEAQFPNKDLDLPKRLLDIKKRGLEIQYCDDIRSYKKFYYTMQVYKNACVVTADDDSFYPRNFISSLVELHNAYPDDIVCRTAPMIAPSYSTPPSKWNEKLTGEVLHSFRLSINSGSGALFPPNSLGEEAFCKEKFMELCPYADDLWLTIMAIIHGTAITRKAYYCYPITISGSQKTTLVAMNRKTDSGSINNDTQWGNLIREYQVELEKVVGKIYQ